MKSHVLLLAEIGIIFAAAVAFGIWQKDVAAGLFMFCFMAMTKP